MIFVQINHHLHLLIDLLIALLLRALDESASKSRSNLGIGSPLLKILQFEHLKNEKNSEFRLPDTRYRYPVCTRYPVSPGINTGYRVSGIGWLGKVRYRVSGIGYYIGYRVIPYFANRVGISGSQPWIQDRSLDTRRENLVQGEKPLLNDRMSLLRHRVGETFTGKKLLSSTIWLHPTNVDTFLNTV
jgi:hypothetical protein